MSIQTGFRVWKSSKAEEPIRQADAVAVDYTLWDFAIEQQEQESLADITPFGFLGISSSTYLTTIAYSFILLVVSN